MTTHGHLCILVLRSWIDYHCMIRMVKHETISHFLYTSRLKSSCRNSYGKTQYMFEQPPGNVIFPGAKTQYMFEQPPGNAIFSGAIYLDRLVSSIHQNVDRFCPRKCLCPRGRFLFQGRTVKHNTLFYPSCSIHRNVDRLIYPAPEQAPEIDLSTETWID